jgi:hypothetical protein
MWFLKPNHFFIVMAGLGPAIHENKLVDPRVKPGDDAL